MENDNKVSKIKVLLFLVLLGGLIVIGFFIAGNPFEESPWEKAFEGTGNENTSSSITTTAPTSQENTNNSKITLSEFNSLRTGMTYLEVVDIIGGYGTLLSETDLGIGLEYITKIYQWDGEGSLGANANVTFQGGKLISKAQYGLN